MGARGRRGDSCPLGLEPDLDFLTPKKCRPLFDEARYKGLYGGRGSGKSHTFADMLVEECLLQRGTTAVCLREIQKTLAQSSKRLIEAKLRAHRLGEAHGFKVFKDVIETPGDGLIIFNGMQDHNAESIKSLEDFRIAWWEEAHKATATSLALLRPTLRAKGAQLWFSWNPKDPPDTKRPETSVDGMFRVLTDLPGGMRAVQLNWRDNPWFPYLDLKAEREFDERQRQPEDYQHIWEGGYVLRSASRVFHNWRVEDFTTPDRGCHFRFGGDFGFSVDPSVLLRCWTARYDEGTNQYLPDAAGRFLMIDYEAYAVGCDVDFTPHLFGGAPAVVPGNPWSNKKHPALDFAGVPGAMQWPIVADSARPETISYLQRHGFPYMTAAVKGPNSVIEGIEFLKAFTIIIHPRCPHAIDEFTLYSWKTDAKTDLVLPILEDKKNHVIDSARYAVEDIRRGGGFFG